MIKNMKQLNGDLDPLELFENVFVDLWILIPMPYS